MLLVTQTHVLDRRFGMKKTIEMLAEAGFDGIDLSMFEMTYNPDSALNSPDRFNILKNYQKIAESCNITFRQAHAPFSFKDRTDEGWEKENVPAIKRSIEAAGFLGIQEIVVHPKMMPPHTYNKDKLLEINLELYNSLKETAKASGTKIALENMWERDPRRKNIIVDSVCASPEEINQYLDALNDEVFTFCLDVGHCALVGREPQDMIRTLGKTIGALHVHDTDYIDDLHTLPYIAKHNWNEITAALGQIGYDGDFTFESDNFINRFDESMTKDVLDFMVKVGRNLISKVEAAK